MHHTRSTYWVPIAATGSSMWFWTDPEFLTDLEENPQLSAWKHANFAYLRVVEQGKLSAVVAAQVVNHLGTSLVHLLQPDNGERVPPLPQLALNNGLQPDALLFARLGTLNEYYCELGKHPSREKMRTWFSKLTPSGFADLMRTAQDVWVWRLHQLFPGGVPEEQIRWFRQEYDEIDDADVQGYTQP